MKPQDVDFRDGLGMTPHLCATLNNFEEGCREFERFISRTCHNATLTLEWAIRFHKPIVLIDLIIKRGGKVNGSTSHPGNPLAIACEYGYFDIAKFLAEKGADIGNLDSDKRAKVLEGLNIRRGSVL